MGEEVDINSDYDGIPDADDDARVLEWEDGLPTADDLTPLSQPLIPLELASAFSITPEPSHNLLDVHRASQTTVSSLRRNHQVLLPSTNPSSSSSAAALKMFPSFHSAASHHDDPVVVEADETAKATIPGREVASRVVDGASESDSLAVQMEDADSAAPTENSADYPSTRASKRPRLAWTPQLHKRFVEVVAHLGLKNAVPKTIMQLMNVEGLTRENVASHLQKYRLYMKRMQGLSDEGPSSSDPIFASTPVPPSLRETPVPMPRLPPPYAAAPPPFPMPVLGPMGMMPPGYESQHFHPQNPYAMFGERPREWPRTNQFGPVLPYPPPHVERNGK